MTVISEEALHFVCEFCGAENWSKITDTYEYDPIAIVAGKFRYQDKILCTVCEKDNHVVI